MAGSSSDQDHLPDSGEFDINVRHSASGKKGIQRGYAAVSLGPCLGSESVIEAVRERIGGSTLMLTSLKIPVVCEDSRFKDGPHMNHWVAHGNAHIHHMIYIIHISMYIYM